MKFNFAEVVATCAESPSFPAELDADKNWMQIQDCPERRANKPFPKPEVGNQVSFISILELSFVKVAATCAGRILLLLTQAESDADMRIYRPANIPL